MATFFYTVRVFSVEDIGVINYSRSIVSYFVLFAGMGIKNYGIREGSKLINEKEKFNNFVSTLFYINIIVVILAYVFLYLFFTVVMFDDIIIYLSIILSFQFLSNFIFLDWVFEIFENYRYLSYLNIIVQAIVLILVIAFVNEPSHIFRYVSISVFLPLIFSIYSFFIAKKHFTFVFIKKNDVKKHLRPIFIIFFTMISTTIYVNSDITILGIMSDNYTVGIYSLSAKLYNIVKMLFISIIVVTIPSLSRDFSNKDHHVYIKKINNLLTTVYSFLLPLILGAFLISK
jgi:O-antigen/teichoic acid export membrane protein